MTTGHKTVSNKTGCVIVAGGIGERSGGVKPKQFVEIGGSPVLLHTFRAMVRQGLFSKYVIVVPRDWISECEGILGPELNESVSIVAGGERRQDSVLVGVRACTGCDLVAIHDGARPFPPADIHKALEVAGEAGGAIYAMPVTDSIKRKNAADDMLTTIPRDGLWSAQTPQIFRTDKILEALDNCAEKGIELSDDASAFEQMGWPVSLVLGTRTNIKITYPPDFALAEFLLKESNHDEL